MCTIEIRSETQSNESEGIQITFKCDMGSELEKVLLECIEGQVGKIELKLVKN